MTHGRYAHLPDLADIYRRLDPEGLEHRYVGPTTFLVRAGSWYSTAGVRLKLAADVTVDLATAGVSGVDQKTGPGTISGTGGTKAITGVGTTFLSDFASYSGASKRALTGTFTSSSTTVTAASGDPGKDRPGIGDLIGTDAKGYRRITDIDDTLGAVYTLTISAAFGTNLSAEAATLIEQPTIGTGAVSDTRHAVDQISSNTALTLVDNLIGSPSGAAWYAGPRYPDRWFYVWLTPEGVVISALRTEPYAAPLSRSRLIGVWQLLPAGSSAQLEPISPSRVGRLFRAYCTYATLYSSTGSATVARVTAGLAFCPLYARVVLIIRPQAASTATNDTNVDTFFYGAAADAAGTGAVATLSVRANDNAEHTGSVVAQVEYDGPSTRGPSVLYSNTVAANVSILIRARACEVLL